MKRGVLIAIIAGVVLLFVVIVLVVVLNNKGNKATNTNTSSNNTLTIWSPFDESAVYQQISADYLKQNPSVKINFQYIASTSDADYEAKVTNAIASGTGPDIILLRNQWLPKHVAQLAPADDSVDWGQETGVGNNSTKGLTDGQFIAQSRLNSAVVAQNSFSNKLYGLPLSVDSLALYVNMNDVNTQIQALNKAGDSADVKTLRAVPQTWGQLISWSELLTKKDSSGNITQSGLAIGTSSNTYDAADVYLAMLYQDGGSLFESDNKTVNLNLANQANSADFPAQDALSLYTSFSSPSSPNYSWNDSMGDPVQAFISGKTVAMIGPAALSSQIIQDTNSQTNFVSIYPLPQPQQIVLPTQSRTDLADYWTQVVSKNSPNKVLAWNYLEYLESQEGQVYSQLTKKPAISGATGSPLSSQTETGGIGNYNLVANQTITSANVYMVEWQQDEQAITSMISDVVDSKQAVKTAVDSAATALQPTTP